MFVFPLAWVTYRPGLRTDRVPAVDGVNRRPATDATGTRRSGPSGAQGDRHVRQRLCDYCLCRDDLHKLIQPASASLPFRARPKR